MKIRILLFSIFSTLALSAQQTPLRVETFPAGSSRVVIAKDGTVNISEGGPVQLKLIPTSNIDPRANVLEFQIFSLGGCKNVTATYPGSPEKKKLADINHSENWSAYTTRLSGAPASWKHLTLDLPLATNASLNIRNVRIRPEKTNEFSEKKADPAVTLRDNLIKNYLQSSPDSSIDQVIITESEVQITLTAGADVRSLFLGELPIHRSVDDPTRFEFLAPLKIKPRSTTTVKFPRKRTRLGREFDRLTSRWQLVKIVDGERLAISHARYADQFPTANPSLTSQTAATKKGLGGWAAASSPKGDLEKLGVSAITVNLVVESLVSANPCTNSTPFQWQGRTYHANKTILARNDATFLEAARLDNLVSVVLLVGNPNKIRKGKASKRPRTVDIIGHPEADPSGAYSMPNMDNEIAVGLYGAAIHLLAERYSRPDKKFGRIHHYIVHNEVDAGWSWTNCGDKPLPYFFDLYHRSMRLIDIITRSQNPHARPFISLTHHWAEPGNEKFYGSKFMLLELVKWTKAEGDFPWALAHHPYPISLRKPRTWEDKVSFDFNTTHITPKNLEVLDAWMKRPDMLGANGEVRPIHLSENGFNSPDYSEQSLTDQAAGMAYAWKKMAALDSMKIWHYHNWVDNRREGGLRLGLRRFPDDETEPYGEKPIFKLYRDLATPREDEACAPYLPVIGIKSWSEIIHRKPIQ